MLRTLIATAFLMLCSGCSSLGVSLYPAGHFLTDQTQQLLAQSPRRPELPRELNKSVLPAHYLQPGDVLLIEPVELDADVRIPADQNVMADGSVDLNAYGRVVVAGLTLEDTEALIEQTIVDQGGEPTEINVRLLEPVDRYYVLGDVNSPGSYPLTGHETVLDGIVAAGGLGTTAAPCKILLARPTRPPECRVTLPICYHEITQLGDTTTNYQLQPGDRIFVASRTWCEELMFWRVGQTCARCRDCQGVCPDPGMATYRNPMAVTVGPIEPSVGLPQELEQPGPVSRQFLDRPTSSAEEGAAEPLPRPATPPASAETGDQQPAPSVRRTPIERDDEPAELDGELEFEQSPEDPRFEPLRISP